MLNYRGITEIAVDRIIEDMQEKMMGENYCINTCTITIDVLNKTMTVKAMRKDPIGIEVKVEKTVSI